MNAPVKMTVHNLVQGSHEWLAHRAACWNASDAPVMLGLDSNRSRTDLLDEIVKGYSPEASAFKERLYAGGHRREALARPLAEQIVGEDLYPMVGSISYPGLQRRVGASFDGLKMARDRNWEHKQLNDELRAALPTPGPEGVDRNDPANLPKRHQVQMEQQCMVAGPQCKGVLFTASDWDDDGNLLDARHCWYTPNQALREEIVAGWAQLEQDAETHVPRAPAAVVVAAPVQALPAVMVQVTGSIAITENFGAFETAVRDFLEHRLIREPKTDQDFADLDVQIKAMKGAEAALDAAEGQMLAQIAAVDTAKKAKDMLAKLVRDNRLMAEKLLATEKERRRGEIVAGGIAALREYVASRNALLGKPYMPTISADFAGCIKGKSSLAKMEDAVATELARAKIAASEVFDRIQTNLGIIHELASDFPALIPDRDQLVLKAPEDCRAMLTSRIAVHQAAEAKRLEEQRERIRAEEVAKLRREQDEREAAERRNQLALEAAATHVAALPPTAAPAPAPTASTAPNVLQMQRPTTPPAMAAAMPATLNLGAICGRLRFTMTAEFLRSMGIEPAATEKAAKLYTEEQFLTLCDSLVAHIRTQAVMANQQQAA